MTGIEQSFREKCHRVKDHIEDLRQRIEKLETNQLEGQCYIYTRLSLCTLYRLAHQLAYPHAGLQLQDCESEIQQLEHKLSDYRDIIGQQEVMLQVCTVSHHAVLHDTEDCPQPNHRSVKVKGGTCLAMVFVQGIHVTRCIAVIFNMFCKFVSLTIKAT